VTDGDLIFAALSEHDTFEHQSWNHET